ncbi:hypothetical protein FRB98_006309 [Tulasnella sp. 332]|nr:hypothetical protein FRB98_006309 [Tulasnella sp. 332]
MIPHQIQTRPFTTATGLAGGLSGPAAPVVIPIAASVALGYYLYTVYKRTPPVIRVLMGYIINLTTILEGLFNLLNSEAPSTAGAQPQILSSAMITRTIENYNDFKRSEDGWRCHSEIRNFVRDSHNIFSSDYRPNVSRELIRLMQAYRFRVVQEWMDKVKETE